MPGLMEWVGIRIYLAILPKNDPSGDALDFLPTPVWIDIKHAAVVIHVCIALLELAGDRIGNFGLYEKVQNAYRLIPYNTILVDYVNEMASDSILVLRTNPVYFSKPLSSKYTDSVYILRRRAATPHVLLEELYLDYIFFDAFTKLSSGQYHIVSSVQLANLIGLSYFTLKNRKVDNELVTLDDIRPFILRNFDIVLHRHLFDLDTVADRTLESIMELITLKLNNLCAKRMFVYCIHSTNSEAFMGDTFTCNSVVCMNQNGESVLITGSSRSIENASISSVDKHLQCHMDSSNVDNHNINTISNQLNDSSIGLWNSAGTCPEDNKSLVIASNGICIDNGMLRQESDVSGEGVVISYGDIASWSSSSNGETLAIFLDSGETLYVYGIVNGWARAIGSLISVYKRFFPVEDSNETVASTIDRILKIPSLAQGATNEPIENLCRVRCKPAAVKVGYQPVYIGDVTKGNASTCKFASLCMISTWTCCHNKQKLQSHFNHWKSISILSARVSSEKRETPTNDVSTASVSHSKDLRGILVVSLFNKYATRKLNRAMSCWKQAHVKMRVARAEQFVDRMAHGVTKTAWKHWWNFTRLKRQQAERMPLIVRSLNHLQDIANKHRGMRQIQGFGTLRHQRLDSLNIIVKNYSNFAVQSESFQRWYKQSLELRKYHEVLLKLEGFRNRALCALGFKRIKTFVARRKILSRCIQKFVNIFRHHELSRAMDKWSHFLTNCSVVSLDLLVEAIRRRISLQRGINCWKTFVMVRTLYETTAISHISSVFEQYETRSNFSGMKKAFEKWRYICITVVSADIISQVVNLILRRHHLSLGFNRWKQFVVVRDLECSYAIERIMQVFHRYSSTFQREQLQRGFRQWYFLTHSCYSAWQFVDIVHSMTVMRRCRESFDRWKQYIIKIEAGRLYAIDRINVIFGSYCEKNRHRQLSDAMQKLKALLVPVVGVRCPPVDDYSRNMKQLSTNSPETMQNRASYFMTALKRCVLGFHFAILVRNIDIIYEEDLCERLRICRRQMTIVQNDCLIKLSSAKDMLRLDDSQTNTDRFWKSAAYYQ